MRKTFPLGQVVATPAVLELIELSGATPAQFLDRHVACDWGDVDENDKLANDTALVGGTRLVSSYALPGHKHEKVLVITEADRSATTIMLSTSKSIPKKGE